MTKPEITGVRDLQFSGWIRKQLPDSDTGFMVSDIDFVLSNYNTRKIMMIEVKTRNATMFCWQRNLFGNIYAWLKTGISKDWKYLGFHFILFENTFFDDGKVYLDYNEIDEQSLIKFLSMEDA